MPQPVLDNSLPRIQRHTIHGQDIQLIEFQNVYLLENPKWYYIIEVSYSEANLADWRSFFSAGLAMTASWEPLYRAALKGITDDDCEGTIFFSPENWVHHLKRFSVAIKDSCVCIHMNTSYQNLSVFSRILKNLIESPYNKTIDHNKLMIFPTQILAAATLIKETL